MKSILFISRTLYKKFASVKTKTGLLFTDAHSRHPILLSFIARVSKTIVIVNVHKLVSFVNINYFFL